MQIVVQVLPPAACLVAIKCSLLLMYAIGSPRGTNALDVTPQTACMLLAVVGSVACVSMCLGVPGMYCRRMCRAPIAIRKMNLLGLVSTCTSNQLYPCSTLQTQAFLLRLSSCDHMQVQQLCQL